MSDPTRQVKLRLATGRSRFAFPGTDLRTAANLPSWLWSWNRRNPNAAICGSVLPMSLRRKLICTRLVSEFFHCQRHVDQLATILASEAAKPLSRFNTGAGCSESKSRRMTMAAADWPSCPLKQAKLVGSWPNVGSIGTLSSTCRAIRSGSRKGFAGCLETPFG